MRDEPTAPALLAEAARVLKRELLPDLAGAKRYQGLMVLNALGIAERQIRAGDDPEAHLHARLADLYDDRAGDLAALEARFAKDIRAGAFDPGTPDHDQARAILVAMTRAKAAESCPKALKRETL